VRRSISSTGLSRRAGEAGVNRRPGESWPRPAPPGARPSGSGPHGPLRCPAPPGGHKRGLPERGPDSLGEPTHLSHQGSAVDRHLILESHPRHANDPWPHVRGPGPRRRSGAHGCDSSRRRRSSRLVLTGAEPPTRPSLPAERPPSLEP
jgi:hypothetical protein